MNCRIILALFTFSLSCVNSQSTAKPAVLGKFNEYLHSVSGCVCATDESTVCLKNFNYDGAGPDAYFWAGESAKPDLSGYIVPNELGSSSPLKGYKNRDLVLKFPAGKSWKTAKYFSVFCRQFNSNFADIFVPADIDQKLANATGASCDSCQCDSAPASVAVPSPVGIPGSNNAQIPQVQLPPIPDIPQFPQLQPGGSLFPQVPGVGTPQQNFATFPQIPGNPLASFRSFPLGGIGQNEQLSNGQNTQVLPQVPGVPNAQFPTFPSSQGSGLFAQNPGVTNFQNTVGFPQISGLGTTYGTNNLQNPTNILQQLGIPVNLQNLGALGANSLYPQVGVQPQIPQLPQTSQIPVPQVPQVQFSQPAAAAPATTPTKEPKLLLP